MGLRSILISFLQKIIGFSESVIGDIKGVRKKDTFAQNFAFVFTGNFLFIVIQLISAPILSRIYSPEAYGLFGIFNAIITNVAMIATLAYPNALILPKEKSKFHQLMQLSFILVLVSSLFSFMIILLFGDTISEFIRAGKYKFIIYLIPPGVLLVGTNQILSQWITREKAFKRSLKTGPATSLTIKTTNILFGLATNGAAFGILIIDFFGRILSFFLNFFYVLDGKKNAFFQKPIKKDLIEIAKEYKRFPKYVFPGNYVNMFSSQMPIYFLSLYFGNIVLGYFTFAASLLDVPMRLLANAVAPVFYQKANEIHHTRPHDLKNICIKLYYRLLIFGILPFSFIAIFGDKIFEFAFGVQWGNAGTFAGVMSFYYFFRLISSPLSSVFNVLGKERLLFAFQNLFFIVRVLALGIGVYVFNDPFLTVLIFSLTSGLAYILLSIMVFRLVKVRLNKVIFYTLAILIFGFGLILILRFLFFI